MERPVYFCGPKPNRVATTDCAAPLYTAVHTDINLVVQGCRAQDSRIFGEISLREGSVVITQRRSKAILCLWVAADSENDRTIESWLGMKPSLHPLLHLR
jgi:hypothetical protein